MTPTEPTPDPTGHFLAANRTALGVVLLVVGLASLIGGVVCFTRAVAKTDPDAAAKPERIDPLTGEKVSGALPPPHAVEYVLAGLVGVFAALVGFGTGGYAVGRPADAADPRETRWLAAVALGGLGVAAAVLGLIMFAGWFPALTAWVTQKSSVGAWKVLVALLAFVVGCGLTLAAVQLLRPDERNSQAARRLVFGTTLGITAVLLVVGLVAVNVLAGVAAPGALDTTTDPDITLNPETTAYLAGMTSGVTAYATFTEQAAKDPREQASAVNLRRLLVQFQAANPQHFKYVPLSLTLDGDTIDKLRKEFPRAFDTATLGVLLVTGDRRAEYLPAAALNGEYVRNGQPTGRYTFDGEKQVVQQLLRFNQDTDRTVYFTQGHGEIALPGGDPNARPDRTGNRLSQALGQDVTVKPLAFGLTGAKVPDDAAVVVVADPRGPFPKADADALQAYMTAPRANGKKGKLLVLAGPSPNPDGKGVVDTGLGPLLGGFGIALGDRYLVGANFKADNLDYTDMPTVVNPSLLRRRSPPDVAVGLAGHEPILRRCREVTAIEGRPAPALALLFTGVRGRVTWQDPNPPTDPKRVLEVLTDRSDPRAAQAMAERMTATVDVPFPVAAIATERQQATEVGRVMVVGCGSFADTDETTPGRPPPETVVTDGVNWLRDLPPVANVATAPKDEYVLKADADQAKMLFLPTFGLGVAVVALGLGVWVFRRK